MMARFKKNPIEVEAFRCDFDWMPGWFEDALKNEDARMVVFDNVFAEIKTLEGTMTAYKGDYIIKGVQGEIYPCKPDIFEKTYIAVDA